jgi:hypothetical protein
MKGTRYRWASLVIDSTMRLPELRRCESAPADFRFEVATIRHRRQSGPWSHRWLWPDGTRWLSIAREGRERMLRFAELADFIVSADRRTIRCEAPRTTTPDTIRHLLLDQVLPALAGNDHQFGIHASAVAIEGTAVGFLGRTGRGKSTLAAAFALGGAPIVTDDCLMLTVSRDRIVAVPTYPSLRLSRSAIDRLGNRAARLPRVAQYSSKVRLGRHHPQLTFRQRPIHLGRLYLLERSRRIVRPRIVPMSARDSYMALMAFRFRLDSRDPHALRRECDQLARMVRALPVARLRIPSGFSALAAVRDAVLADIARADS